VGEAPPSIAIAVPVPSTGPDGFGGPPWIWSPRRTTFLPIALPLTVRVVLPPRKFAFVTIVGDADISAGYMYPGSGFHVVQSRPPMIDTGTSRVSALSE